MDAEDDSQLLKDLGRAAREEREHARRIEGDRAGEPFASERNASVEGALARIAALPVAASRPALRKNVVIRWAFGVLPAMAVAAAVALLLRGGAADTRPIPYRIEVSSGDATQRAEVAPAKTAIRLGVRDDAPVVIVLRPETSSDDHVVVRAFADVQGDHRPLDARVDVHGTAVRVETTAASLRGASQVVVDVVRGEHTQQVEIPVIP